MSSLQMLLCFLIFSHFCTWANQLQSALDAPHAPRFLDDAKCATQESSEPDAWKRLKAGEVLVSSSEEGQTKFVVSRILIAQPPDKVWQVLANPFEFERKISPRMSKVQVLHDAPERSVLRCRMDIFPPIPSISYDVESTYRPLEEVAFHRIGGAFKDFKGCWGLRPHENGASTEVIYSMYIDTGLPVPQWIVRKAIKMELPRTLLALRKRIIHPATTHGAEETRSILAVHPLTTAHTAIPVHNVPTTHQRD